MMKINSFKVASLLIISLLFIVQCKSPDVFVEVEKNEDKDMEDKEITIRQIIEKYYSGSYFDFGCISKASFLKEGDPQTAFYLREFSYNTPENEFKQSRIYLDPNANWNANDYRGLIEMARENNQIMRAHAPIGPQSSEWVKTDNRTPEELKSVLVHYMTNICKDIEANSDVIKWMDVVNETVASDNMSDLVYQYNPGDWFGPLVGTDRWQNPWTTIGYESDSELKVPTYIKLAFEIANKNAPNIKLLYNQHGGMEQKAWDKVKQTVLYLRNIGLRVDAIGWQAHIRYGWEKKDNNMDKLNELIDWCFLNGLEFHVTELDVKMDDIVNENIFVEKAHEIADTYGAITEAMVRKIGNGAVSINCWTPKHSSRNDGTFAGLFDNELKPTLAYYRIKDVLLQNAPNIK